MMGSFSGQSTGTGLVGLLTHASPSCDAGHRSMGHYRAFSAAMWPQLYTLSHVLDVIALALLSTFSTNGIVSSICYLLPSQHMMKLHSKRTVGRPYCAGSAGFSPSDYWLIITARLGGTIQYICTTQYAVVLTSFSSPGWHRRYIFQTPGMDGMAYSPFP
ncbi:hypothetical protein F5Y19DRAFT_237247 [Xylariaceae sp. FL1651]|nr:hypothetical protein F5Y19DRAFT_237247 [Xylariaceae sp. FL1651]